MRSSFDCLRTDDERNDKGFVYIPYQNHSLMEEIIMVSDAENGPFERHGSSFQDELQMMQSEGIILNVVKL